MGTPLVLPSELTIYVVAEQRAAWLDWLVADDDANTVDASRVDEIDAAGLQCLMALARSVARRGRTLRVLQPTDTLRRACQYLGAPALLSDPAAAEGATP